MEVITINMKKNLLSLLPKSSNLFHSSVPKEKKEGNVTNVSKLKKYSRTNPSNLPFSKVHYPEAEVKVQKAP
jgi:hypothetical protein